HLTDAPNGGQEVGASVCLADRSEVDSPRCSGTNFRMFLRLANCSRAYVSLDNASGSVKNDESSITPKPRCRSRFLRDDVLLGGAEFGFVIGGHADGRGETIDDGLGLGQTTVIEHTTKDLRW